MSQREWFDLKSKNAFGAGNSKDQKEKLGELLQYQVSRKRFKTFPRRRDLSLFFGVRWQMDVADLGGAKAFNFPATEERKKLYALIVVDLFSKFVFARALNSKRGEDVVTALKSILSSLKSPFPDKPSLIQSDAGGEFKNDKVKKFLEERNIEHQFEKGRLKNAVVERMIRNFKKVAVLYLEAKPSAFSQWSKIVPQLATLLNSKANRSLGISPEEVQYHWPEIQKKQLDQLKIVPFDSYVAMQKKLLEKNFKWTDGNKKWFINEWVLIPNEKNQIEKETVRNYTYKPWRIVGVSVDRIPYLYFLRDAKGKPADRYYYAKELRPLKNVPLKGKMPLAGVLNERMKNGKRQWLARFVDHDPSFDQWISERKKGFPPPRDPRFIPKGAKPIKKTSQLPGARKEQNRLAYIKRKEKRI